MSHKEEENKVITLEEHKDDENEEVVEVKSGCFGKI